MSWRELIFSNYSIILIGSYLSFQDILSQKISFVWTMVLGSICLARVLLNYEILTPSHIVLFLVLSVSYFLVRKKEVVGFGDYLVLSFFLLIIEEYKLPIFLIACGGILYGLLSGKRRFPLVPAIVLAYTLTLIEFKSTGTHSCSKSQLSTSGITIQST